MRLIEWIVQQSGRYRASGIWSMDAGVARIGLGVTGLRWGIHLSLGFWMTRTSLRNLVS